MKIKKLKLRNFAQFSDFECEFDGQITRLVGVNGSGKTTVGLTAIWAGLKGIAEKSKDGQLIGERFRFIGPKKASADIELTLVDEARGAEIVVNNHLTKAGNQITFTAPKGYDIGAGWLNGLLSVAFLSAKNFTQRTGKEQALLLGIDVSEYDARLTAKKDEFTDLNRGFRALGEIEDCTPAERVSLAELIAEKDKADVFNREQDEAARKVEAARVRLVELEDEATRLSQQLSELRGRITKGKDFYAQQPMPKERIDTTPLVEQIGNAEETNRQAERYEAMKKKVTEKESLAKELEANKEQQEEIQGGRLNYIKSFAFGFDGLSVDDDGALLLDERPIREPYFSKGELEVIVATLHAAQNPELKVRFIDDFELLDEEHQTTLVDDLIGKGFQVITAEVGKASDRPNSIVLRECKVVDGDEPEETRPTIL